MEKIKNAALLAAAMFLSVAVVIFCGYKTITGLPDPQSAALLPSEEMAEEAVPRWHDPAAKTDPPAQSEETTSSAPSSEAVETASPAQAVGKIYEQFFSPYSAGLSYNNIYIKNAAGLSLDLKAELATPVAFKIDKNDQPQVLIVHTHATESYMQTERDFYTAADESRTTDNLKNVVYVGETLANVLRQAGIAVVHDETRHDYPSYTGSYERAAVTIREYLEKYPSIKIVIDLHRDSIAVNETDRAKPTVTVGGRKAAQVMLCMGSQSGAVTGFPEWKQNFRLAARLQQTMEVMYPGLARPMLLASKKYNENLTTGSMLLEVGTESNTLAEATLSAELVGNALVSLLNTLL